MFQGRESNKRLSIIMQKTKTKKYATISFGIGVVSLGMVILLSVLNPEAQIIQFLLKKQKLVAGSIFILSLIGIILGAISIKSEKKILAIVGIIMSIVALVRILPGVVFVFFYGN